MSNELVLFCSEQGSIYSRSMFPEISKTMSVRFDMCGATFSFPLKKHWLQRNVTNLFGAIASYLPPAARPSVSARVLYFKFECSKHKGELNEAKQSFFFLFWGAFIRAGRETSVRCSDKERNGPKGAEQVV